MTRSVLLVGATGLVGRECLHLLLATPVFTQVATLSRRPLPPDLIDGRSAAAEQRVMDFDQLASHPALVRADQIICALGTTIETAGTRERFRHVDFDYPLTIARLGLEQGAHHFLLVSALGANPRSMIFYNRVKGDLEEALRALSYRSLTIVRPSLLVGERARPRRGEEMGKRLSWLVPARYKPISAGMVATALVRAAVTDEPGQRIIESVEIRQRYG
ncbi:MAG TPA: NAD(P)H-binding protein [Gemmatimonadaceae bacterium]|jgi:uncharacterized protein YbjT (DUF2867 family)|nr:NAD(P)H-binding protein [Gemmatimonadaceae bacterium]